MDLLDFSKIKHNKKKTNSYYGFPHGHKASFLSDNHFSMFLCRLEQNYFLASTNFIENLVDNRILTATSETYTDDIS